MLTMIRTIGVNFLNITYCDRKQNLTVNGIDLLLGGRSSLVLQNPTPKIHRENADLDDPIIRLLADKKKTPLSRIGMNLSTLRDHDRCIDHIFITDLFLQVSSTRVLDGSQSSGFSPSDHYGVLARLRFL